MGKKKSQKQQNHKQNINPPAEVDSVDKKRLDRARKICRESVRYAHRVPHKLSQYAEGLDLDEVRSKRRIDATIGRMDEVKAVADSLALDFPGSYDFDEEWLMQNLVAHSGYDFMERNSHNLLAASLWMLDQLREEWQFHSASKVFPRDNWLYDDIDIPEIWDVSHDYDSIMGMLWTIQHRNDDCVGLEEKTQKKKNKKVKVLERYYLDDYTVAGMHRQDVPSRRNFEHVMTRIPQERIDEAVQLFEDTFWDVVRRIIRSQVVNVRTLEKVENRQKVLLEKTESLMAEMKCNAPAVQGNGRGQPAVLAARGPYAVFADQALEEKKRGAELVHRVQQVAAEQEDLERDQEDLKNQIEGVRKELGGFLMSPKQTRQDFYGPEIAEIWDDFQIRDPYALSFAMLYLVEQNSDLPWIYGVTTHMMELCAGVLPWRYDSFNIEEDEYWRHYDQETWDPVPAVKKTLPKRIKVPELEDWYSMQYENLTESDPFFRESNNLAQIVYELTGGIMPRNLNRYEGALEVLDKYGISGKKTVHPLLYCMTLLGEARNQTRVLGVPEYELKLDSKTEESKAQEASVEELKQQLDVLQQENLRLRNTAYAASREAREVRKKLDVLEEDVRAERQELADLRELVFLQRGESYEIEEEDPSIVFPYEVRQRVVVFGGHDSWAKEIKPRLPGVRFVDRKMLPNADLIRQADVIWIQTNALAHKHFYKIIDEVRKYRIPIRYFSYASAVKCAEQVVRDDQESK